MCLTTEALALFLNLIAFDLVDLQPDRIVVRAETRDTHWVARGDRWCTMAPRSTAWRGFPQRA
jgi:aromatic ring-opening dioxygenase catalytic subunit (LigB family)